MKPDRWAQIEALYMRALDCTPGDRAALLARECVGDEELRQEVDSMLLASERVGDFLERPAVVRTSLAGGPDTKADVTLRPPDGARRKLCEQCHGRFGESYLFCPDDGAALVEDPEWLVGTTLDGLYEIEALLGQGGMGTVYRARHVLLRDVVAIKVLPREMSENPMWLARFQREGAAARRFRHPSAVTVYDLRVGASRTAYLVLEYVEGETLRAAMRRRGRIDLGEAVRVVEAVAGALDAAHRAGVVHRDVKPENVMLAEFGGEATVKLLDLGVAKLLAVGERGAAGALTREGAAVGTPYYMSPEQWGEVQRDGESEIDGRVDVYSLGVMAYEMVVGELPFRGTSWQEIRQAHASEVPRPAHERVQDIPQGVGRALAHAMAKDRGDRFATAGELARALREALQGGSTTLPVVEERSATRADAPTNLPQRLTSFVGREREVGEVVRLLGTERLIVVAGPGGIGKTSLALRAAREALDSFPDGVWFADLAPLTDPALVAQAVASALGVRERPDVSSVNVLCEHARHKRLLVVLDNCEHLVGACAELAMRLLLACPEVRILATSREALGVQGEITWQVPPLEAHEAERLFEERARAIRWDFAVTLHTPRAEAVAELCRRLEGVPLAVELAAARAQVLTPSQMLARLGQRLDLLATQSTDAPARHRTLRATIEWSYELLDDQERRAFAALSVFRGGWTLEAAEQVVGGTWLPAANVLDALTQLAAASMIRAAERHGEMRYAMLETIREYGLERLDAGGEAHELRRRHADYFLTLAEAAGLDRLDTREAKWLDTLEEEHDNVRAAIQWLLEHDADACMRLTIAINPFWGVRGHLTEGRRCLAEVLERSTSAPARSRCIALHAAGHLARDQGDLEAARRNFEESTKIAREIADTRMIVFSYHGLGWVAEMQGDLQTARSHWELALAGARELKDDRMIANALNSLGEVARQMGDWAAARELYEQAIVPARRSGANDSLSAALGNLGTVACEDGDLPAASAYYRDALAFAHEIGTKDGIAYTLDGLGRVAARQGAWARAGRLAGAADALREASGYDLDPADRDLRVRYLAEVREALGEEGLRAVLEEGRAMADERAIAYALEEEG